MNQYSQQIAIYMYAPQNSLIIPARPVKISLEKVNAVPNRSLSYVNIPEADHMEEFIIESPRISNLAKFL